MKTRKPKRYMDERMQEIYTKTTVPFFWILTALLLACLAYKLCAWAGYWYVVLPEVIGLLVGLGTAVWFMAKKGLWSGRDEAMLRGRRLAATLAYQRMQNVYFVALMVQFLIWPGLIRESVVCIMLLAILSWVWRLVQSARGFQRYYSAGDERSTHKKDLYRGLVSFVLVLGLVLLFLGCWYGAEALKWQTVVRLALGYAVVLVLMLLLQRWADRCGARVAERRYAEEIQAADAGAEDAEQEVSAEAAGMTEEANEE